MAKMSSQISLQLLGLPREERAALAHQLIRSLDDKVEADVEKSWVKIAQKRLKDFKAGKSIPLSFEKSLARLRKLAG